MDTPNFDSKTDIGNYTPAARKEERGQLGADVERFLQEGGQVAQVNAGERSDPPKKPENNYGRGAI